MGKKHEVGFIRSTVDKIRFGFEAQKVIIKANRGLQDMRINQNWVSGSNHYQYGEGERFTIRCLLEFDGYEDKMKALIENFGQEGPCYPMLASCASTHLGLPTAAKASNKRSPLRKPNTNLPDNHTVVIVDVYTISTNPLRLSVRINNSWGIEWGDGGHAWVEVGFFKSIYGFNSLDCPKKPKN